MSEQKFDVGDVVRLKHGFYKENDGMLATVKSVSQISGSAYNLLKLETVGGWKLEALEYMVVGASLEEVQQHYADKPRDGFIVDELTVDELEGGQEEAYEIFQTAANEANREEERQAAEDDRKERRVLAELTVTAILWVVFTLVSLAMWLVVMWTGETAYAPIGYYSALVSVVAVFKPMAALILVCREQIKERKKRKEEP